MADISRIFPDPHPALRFIGKRYGDPGHWGEWFAGGLFDRVERAMGGVEAAAALWENAGGYVGLERRARGELCEYWIGMFAPPGTAVPEGFECLDVPAGIFGTCWLHGPEGEVHSLIPACREALINAGLPPAVDAGGCEISFENGLCPRFTTLDGDGNVILDYGFIVNCEV